MRFGMRINLLVATTTLAVSTLGFAAPGAKPAESTSFDAVAAQALVKSSKCSGCHAVEKEKAGPSFTAVAKKYQSKTDAMEKLYTHLTNPTVIEVDGEKEEHKMVKPKNEAGTRNLIRWILSLAPNKSQ